jgi:putative hydrolase
VDDPRPAALAALDQAVYYIDRGFLGGQKARAFRNAAAIVADLAPDELSTRVATNTLTDLDGIGPSTGSVITDAVKGTPSAYLDRLEQETAPVLGEGADLRAALRGDCHSHTTWSDGGASLETMVRTAMSLGHDYLVITDHSPRLTIAHGLDPERLAAQHDEIAELAERVAPFRILRGMEVDILEDGGLDLPEELLAELDVVVGSVHSKLAMAEHDMTKRLVLAVSSPHVDILGHCTGRQVVGRGRAQSKFDADIVFAACAQFGTAVEINCRPERLDPPDELLELALEWGCLVSIDTDAHAPGQLEWQGSGCDKAARHGVEAESIVNAWSAEDLLAWAETGS